MTERTDFLSWGRAHRFAHAEVARPRGLAGARAALRDARKPALAFGCGRSYGDSCLNEGGLLLDTGGLDRFLAFDPATGLLEAEAGVRLADVLATVCRPDPDGSAWFPPVTPGTRWVSLGGAVANDVHGKNHHRFGSFGCHVPRFTLLRGDGRLLACSAEEDAALYRATIGGLGLTGLILSVSLQLRRVPGLMLLAEDIRFGNLDDFYALAAESEGGWEYTVAWIDCLARGRSLGRGLFSRANHVPGPVGAVAPLGTSRAVPFAPPFSPLNQTSLRAFNALYFRKLGLKRRARRLTDHAPSLYPLDAIAGWNRLYGSRGFYQYQCVLPPATARDAVAELLGAIAAAGEGSFLAVLKTMGPKRSPGLLSFPMPGTTLALDFPNRGVPTLTLLDRLDAITLAARGRVYPAKDGRVSAAAFAAGYPELERFRRSVDPAFSSSFWRRVAPAAEAVSTPTACPAAVPALELS
jgi:FAD/FMN-containing dehydrogenase